MRVGSARRRDYSGASGAMPKAGAVAHQAASITTTDLAGWMPRKGTSADMDLGPELTTLVARARDADRNNGVARSGINTIIDNVVGSGLRLSARPNYLALGKSKDWAVDWAQQAESLFHAWWWSTACHAGDTQNGDQLLEQSMRAVLMNGDALALPLWLPDRGDGFATKLQTVEADRLCNPDGIADTATLRGGIEFDVYGRPLAYHIRSSAPGDRFAVSPYPVWQRIARKTEFGRLRVVHYFDQERSGQSRGKPILTAVMSHFKQADRYVQAELMAAVVNGMVAATIETPLDQESIIELFSKDAAAYTKARAEHAVRLEGGAMLPLFPGDKMNAFLPQRPAAQFGAFLENVFRIVAVGLDMPYELLLKDFSKTTYSSARASMLEAWRSFNRRRDRLGTGFMDPIYGLFIEEMVDAGRIEAPGFYENRGAYLRCRWIGPGKGWVDPVKEAQAAQIRMDGNVSTLEDECAEQGKDWREVLEQRAVERAEMLRLGLPEHSATRAANPVQQNSNDDQETGEPAMPPPKRPQQPGARA